MGNTLKCIGTEDNFLKRTSITQALRSTIDMWDIKKPQSFCKAKNTVSRTNQQSTDWEKIFNNSMSDRRLMSKIYRELKKLDTNNPK